MKEEDPRLRSLTDIICYSYSYDVMSATAIWRELNSLKLAVSFLFAFSLQDNAIHTCQLDPITL